MRSPGWASASSPGWPCRAARRSRGWEPRPGTRFPRPGRRTAGRGRRARPALRSPSHPASPSVLPNRCSGSCDRPLWPAGGGQEVSDERVDVGLVVVEAEAEAEAVVAVVGDDAGGVEGAVDGGGAAGIGEAEREEVAALRHLGAGYELGMGAGGQEA